MNTAKNWSGNSAFFDTLEQPTSKLPAQLMLELFDQPIYFFPWAARLTGSAMAALWLSYGLKETQKLMGDDYMDGAELFAGSQSRKPVVSMEDCWFEARVEVVAAFMGMSRWEQQTAKKALKEIGVLEERNLGLPAKKTYRIHMPQLLDLLGLSRGLPAGGLTNSLSGQNSAASTVSV